MSPLDTVFWLLNFPASHGFAVVFIAGSALPGLFLLSRAPGSPGEALRRIREREGMPVAASRERGFLAIARRWVCRVLAVTTAGALVIAVLSLVGLPVTRAYIFDNGRPTTALVDEEWITFTTAEGASYTLKTDAFTPSVFPERDASLPSAQPVVVRYLPNHPQAFVIDSSQLPE